MSRVSTVSSQGADASPCFPRSVAGLRLFFEQAATLSGWSELAVEEKEEYGEAAS